MAEYNEEKALDAILEQDRADVAKIPEHEFKSVLLPILVQNETEDLSFERWLDIAGSWQRPIDVLDDKSGEVLFRVPALVGRNGQPTMQRADNSAYEMIENAQRKMRVVPRAGEEMLVRGLSERVTAEGNREAAQQAWNDIYKRYGYDYLVVSTATSSEGTSTESTSSGGSEFTGYDEA